ncbi:MAG: hypothetical protein WCD20_08635 [Rhodomicrobium sp.]
MATIHKLVQQGELVNVTVPLSCREQPERLIYGFPEFKDWLDKVVPTLKSGRLRAPLTPAEQVDDLLYRWITDRQMRFDRALKDLMPRSDEVWEMKTADLRVFGWIYRSKTFIAVFGDFADEYKPKDRFSRPKKSYEAARKKVIRARDFLELDEPKYVTGGYDELI